MAIRPQELYKEAEHLRIQECVRRVIEICLEALATYQL